MLDCDIDGCRRQFAELSAEKTTSMVLESATEPARAFQPNTDGGEGKFRLCTLRVSEAPKIGVVVGCGRNRAWVGHCRSKPGTSHQTSSGGRCARQDQGGLPPQSLGRRD